MIPASLLLLGLLPALVPSTVAGTGVTSRLQLDFAPELVLVTNAQLPALELRATVFLDPVTDDATPIALQPYLQRASTLSLRAAGAYLDSQERLTGALDVLADLYLSDYLVLTATAGATELTSPRTRSLPAGSKILVTPFRAAAGVAFRLGDLRIDVGYRYAPAASTVPAFDLFQRLPEGAPLRGGGGAVLGLRAVLVERIDVRLGMEVSFAGDVYGEFRCDYYPSRRMGLLWGIDFQHGPSVLYDASTNFGPMPLPRESPEIWDRFGARFGLSWWWTRRVGITGSYAAQWYFPTLNEPFPSNHVGQHLGAEVSIRI